MTELSFKSAGVSTREIDLSGNSSITPVGIPAGVIAPAVQGPAFVPITLARPEDFIAMFGTFSNDVHDGPLSAGEWLTNQQAITYLRPLGAGDGTARTTSGNNAGKVTSAGFVVGAEQPQSSLSGALNHNAYANNVSATPAATSSVGRTHFLGCLLSSSAGSSFTSDAGLGTTTVPILRGVLMAASGVILTLSCSSTASTVPVATQAASFTADTVRGAFTGSVNLNSGKQEFVMLLNGHKGTSAQYPNYVTASFDPQTNNYFGTIFNKNPLKLEEAGYVLYANYDINSAIATPTGSGFVLPALGALARNGYEDIAFIITGSQTVNSGTTTAPNFENFEDRYSTSSSPWFISQKFGGSPANLFKVYTLSDGQYPVGKYKISIENITPSNTTVSQYGTFDLLVRDFTDTDANKKTLEAFRGLSLDPTSPNYIAKIIGDMYTFYNFDATSTAQGLQTIGSYPIKSKYIRVSMNSVVDNQEINATALPMGFRGPQHLVTSGSAPMPAFTDASYYSLTNLFNRIVQPPIPMRLSLIKGASPNQTSDKTLYWGVQFEKQISATEPNASIAFNTSIQSYAVYFPNFQTTWMDMAAKDNEGTAYTTANAILDADLFNNNMFSLEKIKVKYNATSGLPDTNYLTSWSYVRTGVITPDPVAYTRALAVTDLTDPSTRTIAKFTVYVEGGFDGVRLFNSDTAYLTNNATVEEINNSTRGFSNGPTVISYITAIDILKDTSEVDIQLLTTPGIRNSYITDTALQAVEDRFDALYILDVEEKDIYNQNVTDPDNQFISVNNTIGTFRGRGINNSFGAPYFPDVNMRIPSSNTIIRVPPSVVVLGAYGKNDAVGHPWFAPAGFNRASLSSVQDVVLKLSRQNMDDLQTVNINPLVSFAGGPVVWGQHTSYGVQSALDRVNVRRLMINLRRAIRKIAYRIEFEPTRVETLDKFQRACQPVLKLVQDQGGVEAYQIKIDTTTTTTADLENHLIKGKIWVVPTRSLEALELSFILTNKGI
jgi:hypothetical protein